MERKEFDDVIKTYIAKRLNENKIKVNNSVIDFDNDNIDLIIEKYLLLKRKYFIINKKMNVIYSKEFKRKIWCYTKNQKMSLNEIENKIRTNQCIKPYLSNGLYLNKFSKEDELFENENIYHVHLGVPDKKEHFVTRTDKLLFFTYDENNVYFLDIKKHPVGDEWNNLSLIKIKEELNIKDNISNIVFGTKDEIINKLNNLFDKYNEDDNIQDELKTIL